MSEQELINTSGRRQDQVTIAQAILHQVNEQSCATWRLDSRFGSGVRNGAWRVQAGSSVAVLKWHDPAHSGTAMSVADFNSSSPYNPDTPAVVRYVRSMGYPTPTWFASGSTAEGVNWSIQEFVDGQPLSELDVASAEVFIELVERQRSLRPPTVMNWNPYIRAHVFGPHPSHRALIAAAGDVRKLLDHAISFAAPYEPTPLLDNEMVHGDLNVSNILMRDGRVVAVVDIEGTGRGCAVYDVLSPAANGVSWNSDPVAVDRLVGYAIDTYGAGPVAIAVACLVIETTGWYLTATPAGIEHRVARHHNWIDDLRPRLE
ncbi:hypothetical protein BH24ACT5_BH24ACT5_08080 [soil metagenome]